MMIELETDLVNEALDLTGVATPSELMRLAIEELIRSRKRKDLLDLAGQIQFRDDFDHKRMRDLRDGVD